MRDAGNNVVSAPGSASGQSFIAHAADTLAPDVRVCRRCLCRITGHQPDTVPADIAVTVVEAESDDCFVCRGVFRQLDDVSILPLEELRKWEYETFWVGSRLEFGMLSREKQIAEKLHCEPLHTIKADVNRELGLRISRHTGKMARMEHPDMLIVIDISFMTFQLEPSPLFIYGRYRKFQRGIPQTKWPCRKCHGKGCSYCGNRGKMYETSVEEIVAGPAMAATMAESHSFHGMGREDIDAVMLGEGRPFVLELWKPMKRSIDLSALRERINSEGEGRIAVSSLRYSSKDEVRRLKKETPEKSYVVRFRILGKINKEKLSAAIEEISGKTLAQRTPVRVAHRRADKVRERRIIECSLLEYDGDIASVLVRAQSGTYIKELVTGDEGRTQPSISAALNSSCEVISLDVLDVSTGADKLW